MLLKLHTPKQAISGNLILPGSKSISNRILIIKALSGLDFTVQNLSDSDDTKHLKDAIDSYKLLSIIDVGHAGTDMRFLTAFLSLKKGDYELTGSERLQQRPVKDLVDVLQTLGADILYKNKVGYPPLLISGKQLHGGKVEIKGNVSSQFITALLLVAPYFTNGLQLTIIGELVSRPYVDMTIELMKIFGASVSWNNHQIIVKPDPYSYAQQTYAVESDWSAASYYYSMVALSPTGTELGLSNLFQRSLQADAACATIYKNFGVSTRYSENEITITKIHSENEAVFEFNFIECPDIAQTLVCTCIALNTPFHITGLQTLKVKETDRIVALKKEAQKFGVDLACTENSIHWKSQQKEATSKSISISTYHDHRMAMSFASLILMFDEIIIEDAKVVSKSYPLFWNHLKEIGINHTEL
ncbi:MAG: 3-phosphoshikimate 1-carboxyvinyltransferase [Bacteroidota bacterium]